MIDAELTTLLPLGFATILFVYHLLSWVVLEWNLYWMAPKRAYDKQQATQKLPIDVLIPARNEEKSIGRLLDSLCAAKDDSIAIYVLDDQSEDATADIVRSYEAKGVQLLRSKPKPNDWRGKNFACMQLSEAAEADTVVFLDADTQIKPNFFAFVRQLRAASPELGLISLWPQQQCRSFWQHIALPWMYRALMTHLPAKYQFSKPLLMPDFIYRKVRPLFAAANGQCMIFDATAYKAIGGHHCVKNEVVEDIALSRQILSAGYASRVFTGAGLIQCFMYENDLELKEGLRKNFFAGFGNKLLPFALAGLLHLLFFISPWVVVFASGGIVKLLGTLSLGFILLVDYRLRLRFKWSLKWLWSNAFGVFWYVGLAWVCVFDHLSGRKVQWKGRKL